MNNKTIALFSVARKFVIILPLILMVSCVVKKPTPEIITPPTTGESHLFSFFKAKVTDSVNMQNGGRKSVNYVTNAISDIGNPTFKINKLSEILMSENNYNPAQLQVNSNIIINQFDNYMHELSDDDTLIVYSHGHGLRAGMSFYDGLASSPDYILWENYAAEFLKLRVKNLIVFTMACYSGNLIDQLNNNSKLQSMISNWQTEQRNLIVISVTDSESISVPVTIDGETLNPLTYAVKSAFEGKADGFQGKGAKDNKTDLNELTSYVLYQTENISADENVNKPQIFGIFNGETIIFEK